MIGQARTLSLIAFLFFYLSTLASDASSELDVFRHDGDSLGMDGAEIGVFEEANEVSLGGFLEGQDSRALEAEIGLEVLRDLSHEALEGKLTDQELRALLILPDLSQGHSAWAEAMGLLHAACSRGGFTSSLCGQLLAGGLPACRLASCLLGPGHGDGEIEQRIGDGDGDGGGRTDRNQSLCVYVICV